jgi:hypothetical protein
MTLDPLSTPQSPDRLFYALGSLLGADDLVDEQSYHRGRLARALAALHGGGTLIGLRVDYVAAGAQPEELQVTPGLALDRFGRLIDVPRTWCIRLDKWYNDATRVAQIKAGFHVDSVVADVFIRFDPNDRGRIPSFASTSYDSINAVSTSRVRDAFFIDLIPRKVLSVPDANWPGIAAATVKADMQKAILNAGKELGADFVNNQWAPQQEHEPGIDTTMLLLARVKLPATDADPKPTRSGAAVPPPDNSIRRFIYPPSMQAQLHGL